MVEQQRTGCVIEKLGSDPFVRAIQPGQDVIAVAGTGNGLDTAVVIKSAYSIDIFSTDPSERPEIHEILAMPREKRWYW